MCKFVKLFSQSIRSFSHFNFNFNEFSQFFNNFLKKSIFVLHAIQVFRVAGKAR